MKVAKESENIRQTFGAESLKSYQTDKIFT